ncbi:hypothetical protein BSKO_01386 [Bryopsis sp. KO-2023]|nr:hypothetical protein BSKO_01386 [Bryopsis sp. KO-2023]
MNVAVEELCQLQAKQDRVRNISVMAHVDHGKTTLSDHLIASNGLIHPKAVGEVRFLDHKEDEQLRGITMKSSSISLLYLPGAATSSKDPNEILSAERIEKGYLINLIDSPGHVDFCSEVSTAARLTDGCLVVVDAVEGVCIQTHAVLRQAWEEKVQPCLVINKMDRLVLELGVSPLEAFGRLRQIVTDVNMIVSAFESERFISEANAVLAHEDAKEAAMYADHDSDELEEDMEDMFDPCKGNVVFGSAYDGWAFRIQQFAEMYAAKQGASATALERGLWGDYFFQPKTKAVVKGKLGGGGKGKPMFVQFILEPIWNAYSVCAPGSDVAGVLGKIVKGRNLTRVDVTALKKSEPHKAVKTVLSAWLPLSEAILGMVVRHLPSPQDASEVRISKLMTFPPNQSSESGAEMEIVQRALKTSDSLPSAPLVIFISKMMAVPVSVLPRSPGDPIRADPNSDEFLAFGRVFSGIARAGMEVHVLSPAYDPTNPDAHRQVTTLGNLYLMMGRGLEKLQVVPAGNVFAVGGLGQFISKSATISSTPMCPPLAPMTFQSSAIVRVAVEPVMASQMHILESGLTKLGKADPFVEVEVLDSGEHVLGAAGEVHLDTCLKELRERFAKIELEVSEPLVAFRETVSDPQEAPDRGVERTERIIEAFTPTGLCGIRVRARPVMGKAASILDNNRDLLMAAIEGQAEKPTEIQEIGEQLKSVLADAPEQAVSQFERAWVLGPKQSGPNLLLAKDTRDGATSLFDAPLESVVHLDKKQRRSRPPKPPMGVTVQKQKPEEAETGEEEFEEEEKSTMSNFSIQIPKQEMDLEFRHPEAAVTLGFSAEMHDPFHDKIPPHMHRAADSIKSGICAGFQHATSAGPLCMEPMWGVAFEVEAKLFYPIRNGAEEETRLDLGEDVYGPFFGQVMTVVSMACRRALLESDPRLVEAMYLCEVSSASESLSGVYAVLSRRRSRILREEMREGSDLFTVLAYLPVEASFGLADELRKKTSGAASASLLLSHWERLQVDPFFVPITEEEREEFGEAVGTVVPNLARTLIDRVRKRKGLPVEEKVVESATKQRTRARKV